MGGRDVQLFESEKYLGGHSYTHHVPSASGGPGADVDMGFIFGKHMGYTSVSALMDAYGLERVPTTLAICSTDGENSWCNTRNESLPAALTAKRQSDTARFLELVRSSTRGLLLTLTPFGIWLKWHGFDRDFLDHVIQPCLSLLFISKFGVRHQPAGVVLRYFDNVMYNQGRGWLYLRQAELATQPVWRVKGGSATIYRALTEAIGRERIHLGTGIASIVRTSDGSFQLTSIAGDDLGVFEHVITTTPADRTHQLLERTSGVPFVLRWLLTQVTYTTSQVTLHSDTSMVPPGGWPTAQGGVGTGYHIKYDRSGGEPPQMWVTGQIGRLFDYKPKPGEPEILLTAGDPANIKGPIHKHMVWAHHTFDLYFAILVNGVLPWLNGMGNVHIAGGWTKTIGHDDAMISGTRAACATGLPLAPLKGTSAAERTAYKKLLALNCGIQLSDPKTG